MTVLLMAASKGWILDVVFFAVLLLGLILGIWKGFVKQITKAAGWIFSFVIAFFFSAALSNQLESWFGLTTLIGNGINSYKIAGWISIAISFVGLAILVRLLAWAVGAIGKAIVKKSKFLNGLDKFLGAIWGLFWTMMFLIFALAVCRWIPSEGLHNYINSSFIVSKIFNWEWFWTTLTRLPGMI